MINPKLADKERQMLTQWYLIEKRSYRYIFEKLNFNNARVLKGLLTKYGIPVRPRSEAVATQWINNNKRRIATSERAKKNFAPFWDQKFPEAYKKISEAKKGPKNAMYGVKGPLHHHFLGGKSTWEKGRKIRPADREKLLKELGGKCVRCLTEEDLTINHKIPWRIVRHHESWNLEILCKKCHFSGPNKDR